MLGLLGILFLRPSAHALGLSFSNINTESLKKERNQDVKHVSMPVSAAGSVGHTRACGKSKTTITLLVICAPKYFSSTVDFSFFFFFSGELCGYTSNSPVSLVAVQMTLSLCLHTRKAEGREKECGGLNQPV